MTRPGPIHGLPDDDADRPFDEHDGGHLEALFDELLNRDRDPAASVDIDGSLAATFDAGTLRLYWDAAAGGGWAWSFHPAADPAGPWVASGELNDRADLAAAIRHARAADQDWTAVVTLYDEPSSQLGDPYHLVWERNRDGRLITTPAHPWEDGFAAEAFAVDAGHLDGDAEPLDRIPAGWVAIARAERAGSDPGTDVVGDLRVVQLAELLSPDARQYVSTGPHQVAAARPRQRRRLTAHLAPTQSTTGR